MQRATAGATASLDFTIPTAAGTYSALVRDGQGRDVTASVSAVSTTATVSIASTAWNDGQAGLGRIEVMQDNAGTKTAVVSERFRIMPGLAADPDHKRYFS